MRQFGAKNIRIENENHKFTTSNKKKTDINRSSHSLNEKELPVICIILLIYNIKHSVCDYECWFIWHSSRKENLLFTIHRVLLSSKEKKMTNNKFDCLSFNLNFWSLPYNFYKKRRKKKSPNLCADTKPTIFLLSTGK